MKETTKVGGVSANVLILPLVVLLVLLHILIIYLIVGVNRADDSLADLIQRSGGYQQDATNLQAGSSVLSETAASFVQMPVTPDGETNSGPLMTYAEELGRDRRGEAVVERFQSYDVSDEVRAYVETAAESSRQMLDIQTHAISLLRSVYPLPPAPALEAIPNLPLTGQELAMPEEARVGLARSLMLGKDYSMLKFNLANDIEACHETLQREITIATAKTQHRISNLRTALWAVIFTIIGTLVGTFALYYRWLINPLRTYASQIDSDQAMEQKSGIREMRVMVNAYNTLLRRRNKLDSILRAAAETDALTGLPNRYSFERTSLDIAEEDGSIGVLLFDLNFLKQVNDTQGHLAGDQLIRTAASCIRECFDTGSGNCFSIGGDEFAAILCNCTKADITARIDRFALAQERENISVSVGYAFAEETDEAGFKLLVDEADKHMYEQKKQVHEKSHTER